MKPCKRRDFIKKLKILGFKGPFPGTKHNFMIYDNHRLTIPSNEEYSGPQMNLMLREVNEILSGKLSKSDWENL